MLPKKMLERMTQEELYNAFLQISELIENETIAQFAGETAEVVPFTEYLSEAMELLADPNKMYGVQSGYTVLDEITRGFEPSELIVVGAVEGVGKSMFVQNIFHNMGSRGIPNLFVSMEMSNQEAEKRYIEMQMGATGQKREASIEAIKKMPLYAFKFDNMNLDKLDEKIGESIEKYDIQIVGIDHLHYFAPQNTENASAAIGYLIRKLKLMARKHKVPIVVISHLTKLKKKGMPDKGSLRDSSFIAQDADCVIMLNRDWGSDDPVKRDILEFDVQKNRTRGNLESGRVYIKGGHKIWETP